MTTYREILRETHIEKLIFSGMVDALYYTFLAEEDNLGEQTVDLVEMELILGLLQQEKKIVKYLLYNDTFKTREQEAQAIGFLSKIDYLRETFDILQGKINIEDIEAAAKTFAPKMQSSFEK